MSAPQPEEPSKEKTTNEDNKFEGQAKESEQEDVKIGEDQRLQALPENEEEEKEEILLTAPNVELAKPKPKPKLKSSSKFKSSKMSMTKSSRMRQRDDISSAYLMKQMGRQTNQIDKIGLLLRSLQSQIKQLQNQVAQIQKIMTKTTKKTR
jgi:hypothetical protein